jgi:hypothetical protein
MSRTGGCLPTEIAMLDTVRPSLAGFFEGTNPKPPVHLDSRYDASGNFLF